MCNFVIIFIFAVIGCVIYYQECGVQGNGRDGRRRLDDCVEFASWTAARETCEAPGARLCELD